MLTVIHSLVLVLSNYLEEVFDECNQYKIHYPNQLNIHNLFEILYFIIWLYHN